MEFLRCYACMRELDAPGAVCPHCGYDNTEGPKAQPDHVLPCGTVLAGRYLVGRVLGQGGFGITYMGWSLSLEMPVCIKEYFPDGAAMRSSAQGLLVCWGGSDNAQCLKQNRELFVREARKAARLSDLSAVVKVWDVFYENDTAYIVMNYIEGETLNSRLLRTQRALGERECVELLRPVIRELAEVHERGIIHRDISPDNLMLRPDGKLVLLDLGAAKDLSGGSGQSSFIVAKRGFTPKEQYRKNGRIGSWTDVYAVCATMVWCMTGRLLPTPLDREDGEEIDLSAFSPAMRQVLEKGLALRPEDRFQSMDELLTALAGLNAGAPARHSKPPAAASRPQRQAKRTPPDRRTVKIIAVILACAAVFALVILAALRLPKVEAPASPAQSAEAAAEPEATPSPTPTAEPTLNPTPTPEATPKLSPESAAYVGAETLLASGDKARAATAFYKLGDYSDARQRSFALWREITPKSAVSAGYAHTVGLLVNGMVIAVGNDDYGQCEVSDWTDVAAVAAGSYFTVGLQADGSAVAAGGNSYGQCNVAAWTDLIAVAAGNAHTVGLRSDGAVVAAGSDEDGQCKVSGWTDIVAVAAGMKHTVGLRADGTVLAVGSNESGQCEVSGWTDIVAVAAGWHHTLGLKADGAVVAAGYNEYSQCEVSKWADIVAIAAGRYHSLGLRSDGAVLAVGNGASGQCAVTVWTDVAAVAAGAYHSLGLRSDGTLAAVGNNWHGECDVSDWAYLEVPARGS